MEASTGTKLEPSGWLVYRMDEGGEQGVKSAKAWPEALRVWTRCCVRLGGLVWDSRQRRDLVRFAF